MIPTDSGEDGGTKWESWKLRLVDAAVEWTRPSIINRDFGAVTDTIVAALRLDVPALDTDDLLARFDYFVEAVEKCGGRREHEVFTRIDELTGWRKRATARRDESFQCSSGKSPNMAIKLKYVRQPGNILLERYP